MEYSTVPFLGSMTPAPRTPDTLSTFSVRDGTWLLSQQVAAPVSSG